MSKFGWSYPPGCSGTPYDEDPPCEVCGLDPCGGENGCQCPECPDCGTAGIVTCYEDHALAEDMSASAVMAAFALVNPKREDMERIVNDWCHEYLNISMVNSCSECADFYVAIDRLIRAGNPVSDMIDAIYDIGVP